jgi:hypothetical protein
LCEVQAFRRDFDIADDSWSVGFRVETSGVVGGELQAVEQGSCATDVEVAGGQGVYDGRECNLNGFAVFECRQLDVLAGQEVTTGGAGVAKLLVALVQAGVEVAPLLLGESWSLALKAVGLDVTAERVLHGRLLWGCPPRGLPLKVQWLQELSEMLLAKFVQPLGL